MAEAEGQPHPVEEPRPEEHPCPINNKGEDERDYIYELWKWGRIVLAIWLLYIVFLFWADDICAIIQWTPHLPHKDTAGVFGDYFGALNALFAGLAFAGLIVTIRQQSADLQATKKEMEDQTKQFEAQTGLLQKQIEQAKHKNEIDLYSTLLLDLDKDFFDYDKRHIGGKFMQEVEHLFLAYLYKQRSKKSSPNREKVWDEYVNTYHETQSLFNKSLGRIISVSAKKTFNTEEAKILRDMINCMGSGETKMAFAYFMYTSNLVKYYPQVNFTLFCQLLQIPSIKEVDTIFHDKYETDNPTASLEEKERHIKRFIMHMHNNDLKENL
ncbi:MAG: hypothetical protein KBT28_10525 [Bacteroidales bacterium]|nr:hypothetical protein [Candidatus Colimorpha merdihippi]